MKRDGRPFNVRKDAAWLVSTAIRESRAKLALPNNDAPVGADVFVDSLEYLLASHVKSSEQIRGLRAENRDLKKRLDFHEPDFSPKAIAARKSKRGRK